jgi:hypothetical protein
MRQHPFCDVVRVLLEQETRRLVARWNAYTRHQCTTAVSPQVAQWGWYYNTPRRLVRVTGQGGHGVVGEGCCADQFSADSLVKSNRDDVVSS